MKWSMHAVEYACCEGSNNVLARVPQPEALAARKVDKEGCDILWCALIKY